MSKPLFLKKGGNNKGNVAELLSTQSTYQFYLNCASNLLNDIILD